MSPLARTVAQKNKNGRSFVSVEAVGRATHFKQSLKAMFDTQTTELVLVPCSFVYHFSITSESEEIKKKFVLSFHWR